nr:MAG TPA: hypothetical protein [Caudoviricetes sp.]
MSINHISFFIFYIYIYFYIFIKGYWFKVVKAETFAASRP